MAARSDDVSSASSWPPETDLQPVEPAGQPPGAPAQWDAPAGLGGGWLGIPAHAWLALSFCFLFFLNLPGFSQPVVPLTAGGIFGDPT